jgi:CheY-like chemotaxis protein
LSISILFRNCIFTGLRRRGRRPEQKRARGTRSMVPFGVALRDENFPVAPARSNQSSLPARPRSGRPHVLVVDDLPIMRAAVRRLLEHAGMTVVAETGAAEQTIAALAAHAPDVVLIDLRMTRMDVLGVIRRLRQAHPAVQVVVHTGSSRSDLLQRAVEAGATGVPSRDGTPWELVRAIDRAYRTGRNVAGTG